ncbi:MAG: glycosyltransferase family 2 protein [Dehalococcoidia bacterium]
MTSPTASVIVLGYNGRRYLDACLSSLLDQEMSREAYEVIYVDNASTDGASEFVEGRFPHVRVVRIDRNYGFAEGNNRAVAHTNGRYVATVNQDTVCHRRWLPELIAALEAHPDAKAAHSNILTPWCPGYDAKDRDGLPSIVHVAELTRYGFVAYEQRPFSPEPIETLFLAGAATIVEREMIDRYGYFFDADFWAYCEDTDLGLRVHNLGYKNLLVPTSVVYHDLTPATSLGWGTLRKTLMILRNRGLAFYKNMTLREFATMLPWLLIGAPLKPGELSLGSLRGLLYGLGTVPLLPVACAWGAVHARKLAGRRRDVLRQRVIPPFELVHAVRGAAPP